jgi:hypothetical protein
VPYNPGIKSGGYSRYGTVMNAILAPLNLAKGFNWSGILPSQADSNGYPTSPLSSTIGSQGSVPSNYYGSYVWSWNGAASMTANGSCAIIYSSANCTIGAQVSSCVGNNFTIVNTTAGINPRVVFKYGLLITGVSGGSGSAVVLTLVTSNFALTAGNRVKIQNGVSINLANGPNSDGSWTISAGGGGNTITLANSTGVTSPMITGTGGPGVQSEAVWDNAGVALNINSGGTISGFTNLIYCQSANESAIIGGQLVDPAYVSQLKQLGVHWLRVMDICTVQASWETNFSARTPSSYINWPAGYLNSNYWVGTIHNSGSDAYTCSAPSLTNAGAYHNGEIVQGTIDITNSGGTPTLNVNSRGAKKIILNAAPFDIVFPNPAASAGQSMQYTFTAAWLNGGTPYVFTYTTTTTGHYGDDTVSASTLQANVNYAMNHDATLTGKVMTTNSGGIFSVFHPTPQGGVLTISYSGPVTSTIINLQPNFFTASGNYSFMYSYVLDAWTVKSGGVAQSVPLEYIVQLCNQANANLWYNWPVNTSSAYVTALTNYVAANLNSNLYFGTELGNEVWNFGAAPWAYAFSYGFALGFQLTAQYQNGASYSWTGLKTKQFASASIAAWTGAGRARSQHYILGMSAEWDLGNTDTYAWQGKELDASANTTYGSYGGVDGIGGSTNAGTTYTASPNRPVDTMDATGYAPYWGSDFLSGDTGGSGFGTNTLTGTVAQNAPLFITADKYRDNNLIGGSGAYDDLYSQFYASASLGGPAGGLNLLRNYKASVASQLEGICLKYDHGRSHPIAVMHYEAGPQFGLGNINNGTNSPTVDIAAVSNHLASNIVNNAWDISAYTTFTTVAISSGTYDTSTGLITLTMASAVTIPTAAPIYGLTGTGANLSSLNGGWNVNAAVASSTTVVLKGPGGKGTITISGGTLYLNAMDLATNLCGLVYNFKFSTQFYNLYKNYMIDVTTVHSGREACASQYGYSQNQWGLFPGNWAAGSSTAYSSYQAITDFNSGK